MRLEIFFKIGFSLKSNDLDFEIVNFPFLDGDVPRSPSYDVYISQLIRFARVFSNIDDFNNRTLFLTAKLLKQGYRYHKIRKAFSKLYHRDSELIVKYNIRLKTLLQQGISEPTFYGDLVYKFNIIVGNSNFSDQFKKIVKRYKKKMLLFICASWSPAGKGLTSWLSFVVSSVSLSLSHWYPGSGVVLDCIDS